MNSSRVTYTAQLRVPVLERRQHTEPVSQRGHDYADVENLVRSEKIIKLSRRNPFGNAVGAERE